MSQSQNTGFTMPGWGAFDPAAFGPAAFGPTAFGPTAFGPVQEYWVDAWQRSILFLDVLRQRGNISREHNARPAPNVLSFAAELLVDGRTLPRPVNYALVRIVPPAGTVTDPAKRPFIVFDPRAGHGPGIGGMKHDSEIGVALQAGHPCYFVGFLPAPMPGQTVEDVCRAETVFIETVAARHPQAEGKPVLIGNCQAGWQIMMAVAMRPELPGPIMLAGAPLSYWAGVHGKNPLRYLGGLLGGTWLTALTGDLGHGIFDGAHLVANFESMNPANTYWKKAYNVYSRIDTEAKRFLEFETWWGSPVLLNAEEMQWIADNLFVGNRLATGGLRTSDGLRIDLRNIRSPIIVFCSWGDDITPPQQALGWITDLYADDSEIVANGQTIVYTLHDSIGHLGIFVSGKVATKEHGEFASCMDMIDLMPPGLYEAVITEVTEDMANPELIHGRYLFRLEARSLADIRALGNNDAADELRFAAAARLSEVNLGLYRTLLSPWVRAVTTEQSAETMRQLHPNRVQFAAFADENPLMKPLAALAESVRADRRPVAPDNPLLAIEQAVSSWITTGLQAYGAARDMFTEQFFLTTYGSPVLQALLGLGTDQAQAGRHIEHDLLREATEARHRAELETKFAAGGLREALLRALIYIRLPERSADERGFAAMELLRQMQPPGQRFTLAALKQGFAEQFMLLRLDQDRALRALPALLAQEPGQRRLALTALRRIIGASGTISAEGAERLARMEAVFSGADTASSRGEADQCLTIPQPAPAAGHERYEQAHRGGARAAADPHGGRCIPATMSRSKAPSKASGSAWSTRSWSDRPRASAPRRPRPGSISAPCRSSIRRTASSPPRKAVEQVRLGNVEALMKGSLHTDELMAAVVAREGGIRTGRRVSHCFVMAVPGHADPLIVTDAAVNIAPTFAEKVDIVQNAIDLAHALRFQHVRVAILSAMETINAKVPSTLEAAGLCKMADRGQITGAVLDGPLALDNAINPEAAAIKGIVSSVAGRANVLVVPDLEAGNMLAKSLTFLAGADAAGIVLGARVPIILTSRADSLQVRLASCAVASLVAAARRAGTAPAVSQGTHP